MVSLNAFSEGHRMAKEAEKDPNSPFGKHGPGYALPEEQTVQYVAIPFLKVGSERAQLDSRMNRKELSADEIGMFDS